VSDRAPEDRRSLKISVVTVGYNAAGTIEDTIRSVAAQNHPAVEHIVVDGGSRDGTRRILHRHAHRLARWVSEPDRGLYDAMNKGIGMATGDVIGTLNADDVYATPDSLAIVAAAFAREPVEAVFGDLVFVSGPRAERVVRYYRSVGFTPNRFARGRMPAHPTFFVRRSCYTRYGLYKTDYRIAADFELLARFLKTHGLRYRYLPEVLVRMRTGGLSTGGLRSNWILNREIIRACAENDIATNYVKVYSKYLTKFIELIRQPPGITPWRNRPS
jgi:glycosyltransferase involved in cell wall biosynthesis